MAQPRGHHLERLRRLCDSQLERRWLELVAGLGRWAVCSNKQASSGTAELARLGWRPEVALFADAFDGPKQLTPVLERLDLTATDIVYVGDTAHDRACAAAVGCRFVLAGWNPRAEPAAGDIVAADPRQVAFANRQGIHNQLVNRTPDGSEERVGLVTTFLSDGNLFYMLTIVPSEERGRYQSAFNRVATSLRLNDR